MVGLIMAVGVQPALAQTGTAGELGQIYDLGVGPHSQGMGEAVVAMGDDFSTLMWNPAGVPFVDYSGLGFSQQNLFVQTSHQTVSYLQRLGRFGWGFVYSRLGSDGFEAYDASGNRLGSFSVVESNFQLSGGYRLTENFAIGLSGKQFRQKIYNTTRSSMGVDAGVFYRPYDWWRIGASARNLVKPKIGPDEFPLTYRYGTAFWLWENQIRLAADMEKSSVRDGRLHLGIEFVDDRTWPFDRTLTFRGGLSNGRVTFGASVIVDEVYKVDYSLVDHEIGLLHQFGFNYRWDVLEDRSKGQRFQDKVQGVKFPPLPVLRTESVESSTSNFSDTATSTTSTSSRVSNGDTGTEPTFRGAYSSSQVTDRTDSSATISSDRQYQWKQQNLTDASDTSSYSESNLQQLHDRVRHFLNEGQLDRASRALSRARQLEPNNEMNQKLQEKLNQAVKSLPVQERRARLNYRQGLVEYSDENYRQAIRYWQRSLEIDPSFQKAKTAIKRTKKILQ
jgi:hypothetical protein